LIRRSKSVLSSGSTKVFILQSMQEENRKRGGTKHCKRLNLRDSKNLLQELPGDVQRSASKNSNYMSHYKAMLAKFHKYAALKEGWFTEKC
jgi:hypothetical protein